MLFDFRLFQYGRSLFSPRINIQAVKRRADCTAVQMVPEQSGAHAWAGSVYLRN